MNRDIFTKRLTTRVQKAIENKEKLDTLIVFEHWFQGVDFVPISVYTDTETNEIIIDGVNPPEEELIIPLSATLNYIEDDVNFFSVEDNEYYIFISDIAA